MAQIVFRAQFSLKIEREVNKLCFDLLYYSELDPTADSPNCQSMSANGLLTDLQKLQ